MSYSLGHPVRPIGGRLVLDFLNTADWSGDGAVLHEKIETLEDAGLWMKALDLPDLALPASAAELRDFRHALRSGFFNSADRGDCVARINAALRSLDSDVLRQSGNGSVSVGKAASLEQLIALSAASVLADPREAARIKRCPAEGCGWLFLDETKNARRKWCSMETCGNRAKARRSYARSKGA